MTRNRCAPTSDRSTALAAAAIGLLLGIAIGVAAVILLTSLGEGARRSGVFRAKKFLKVCPPTLRVSESPS